MIGKISGLVDLVESNYLILDVNGVGYLLHCSAKTLNHANSGARLSLFVETHVKEDRIVLYGFMHQQDRLCFLELTTVKGIGPRIALHVLGHLTPGQVCNAIKGNDKRSFANISGLGPKLVDRMFAELKSRAFINNFADDLGGSEQVSHSNARNDAVDVLVNLGVTRAVAASMVARILSESPKSTLNDIVRCALSEMSMR
jgi:Holliday junction DNA helicase RuvA